MRAVTAPTAGKASALLRAERVLADVDIALERLDAGTYGRCELCEAELDDALVEEDPCSRRCRAHVSRPAGVTGDSWSAPAAPVASS